MTDEELIARLRAVCTCNIDSSPCMAEDDCRDAIAAADRIEQLVKDKRWIMEERDRTFALMLARAEAAETQIAALTARVEGLTGALNTIFQVTSDGDVEHIARAALTTEEGHE